MTATVLSRSVFLFVALFAVRSTPVAGLQALAEELHSLLTTGTSVWVLAAILAALIIGHPALRQH